MNSNKIAGWMISDKGAIKIADAVKAHPILEAFLICGREISDKTAERLSECIKDKPKLRKVCIWGSDITEKGVTSFFNTLRSNKYLQVVHIGIDYYITRIGSNKLSESFCEKTMKGARELHKGCESIYVCNEYEGFYSEFIAYEPMLS